MEIKKIAIFTKDEETFKSIKLTPKDIELKRIVTIDDLKREKFIGVILTFRWYECFSSISAYDELARLQPELLTK